MVVVVGSRILRGSARLEEEVEAYALPKNRPNRTNQLHKICIFKNIFLDENASDSSGND